MSELLENGSIVTAVAWGIVYLLYEGPPKISIVDVKLPEAPKKKKKKHVEPAGSGNVQVQGQGVHGFQEWGHPFRR